MKRKLYSPNRADSFSIIVKVKIRKVQVLVFKVHFSCECVNLASSNSTHSTLIISEINRGR